MAIQFYDAGDTLRNMLAMTPVMNNMKRDKEMRNFLAESGQAVMAGDPAALAGLAQHDVGLAFGIQRQMADDERAKAAEGRAKAAAGRDEQLFQRQMEEYAAKMSAQEAEIEQTQTRRAIQVLSMADGPDKWDALVGKLVQSGDIPQDEAQQFIGQFDNRETIIRGAMTWDQFLEERKGPQANDQRARKIADYMRVYGYDEATATALADDIIAISRDPLTGEATLVDKRSILGAKDAYGTDAPVDASAGKVPPLSFNLPGVNDAFGLEGFGKGLVNTGADIIGAPVPFADVQEAQSDFAVLKEDILSDLANGYRRQPPSWVLQALDGLTPKAGQPFSGAQGAQSKLRALDRKFEREIGLAQQQLRRRMKPGDRAEIEGQLTALESARARVQGMLGAFGGGNSAGSIPQLFLDGVGDLPDGLTAADVWAEMSDDEKAAFQQ